MVPTPPAARSHNMRNELHHRSSIGVNGGVGVKVLVNGCSRRFAFCVQKAKGRTCGPGPGHRPGRPPGTVGAGACGPTGPQPVHFPGYNLGFFHRSSRSSGSGKKSGNDGLRFSRSGYILQQSRRSCPLGGHKPWRRPPRPRPFDRGPRRGFTMSGPRFRKRARQRFPKRTRQ